MPKISLLNIGTELLKGDTVNTNASWIGQTLKKTGFALNETFVIHDEHDPIRAALDQAMAKHEVVIITGGLGPTKDDITKKTLLEYFGGEMVLDEPTMEQLAAWYKARNREMNEFMRQQAYIPSSSEVLLNKVGSAPGMLFRKEGKQVFSLPGVPQEMRYLMESEVLPHIKKVFQAKPLPVFTLRTFDLPESEIADRIHELDGQIPDSVTLSFLPSFGHVKIEITGQYGHNKDAEGVKKLLKGAFQETVFSESEDHIEKVLGDALKARGMTVAFAESCTGGSLAAAITSVSGASKYFKGSMVTYWEEAKVNLLGVPPEMIEAHTVVSEEVAKAMAKGARERFGSDIALSATGAAEVYPEDPVYDKPVIWIGYSDKFGEQAKAFSFYQDRGSNITRAVKSALFMGLKKLSQNFA